MPIRHRTSLKIAAAVLGIVAAGAPVILFNAWVKRQGDIEVAVNAAWALASAESRLDQAATAIQELAARGIDACRPSNIDPMRQAVLRTGPIKQIALIGSNGDILCTDNGTPGPKPQVLATAPTAQPDMVLDAVTLGDSGERFVRVRKLGAPDKPSLAALVAASQLLPQASMRGGSVSGFVRMAMTDGTLLADAGASPDPTAQQQFADKAQSQQFPLAVTVSMPRTGMVAGYDDLRRIGMVATGGIALVILFFAGLLTRRRASDAAAKIAKAIADNEFVPFYQPLVDLQSGKLLGAEVLVRWRRDEERFAEASSLFLTPESKGLALDFTRKLMSRVRDEIGEAIGRRPGIAIAFNVAPHHFDDALILNDVGTIFDKSKMELSQIVLELTERHEVADLAGMRRTIAALQRVGCRVAVDDVGTGHSGLAYLLKLGVDIIKIDRVFVESLESEGRSKAIIETLIDLAKNMRMEIVAEGVETFDQVTYLRERGIHAAQGNVFAPPLPAGTFLELLEAMNPVVGDASSERSEQMRAKQMRAKSA